MKFATAKEHRDFFHTHGWIEFENLVDSRLFPIAEQGAKEALSERLKLPIERLSKISSEKLFMNGRDLWRSQPILQKLATQAHFAEIAAELVEKRILRLGYDQFFPDLQHKPLLSENETTFSNFLQKRGSLQEVSCMSDVICGFVLAFDDRKEAPAVILPETLSGIDIFPSKKGNIIFFKPNLPINWISLEQHFGQTFYMVVYTSQTSHYALQLEDPHTHALKRLGYVFNDQLTDKLHPIVLR